MKLLARFFIVGALLLLSVVNSYAIPAFARINKLSCKTCHSPFPKLNAFGEEFAANGFVIPDQKIPRNYFRNVGDDELSLIKSVPFALRLEGFITYNNGNSSQFDFTSPYLLKFLSGGPIAKNVSYYFYFFMDERGEVAGLEDAFVQFTKVGGSNLSITLGQFQVSDPLFKRELRLTLDDYMIYKVKPGLSDSSLTYDRGVMFSYGFKTGTDVVFQILNGNGIDVANEVRNYDTDKDKNFMLRLSQSIGENFRVGCFGYDGSEKRSGLSNDISMYGVDFTVNLHKKWDFNFQYVYREDDNPFFVIDNGGKIETKGGFAELVYMPEAEASKWYCVALYNWITSDQTELEMKSFTFHYGYVYKRNMRFTCELSYVYDDPNFDDHLKVAVGLIAAF